MIWDTSSNGLVLDPSEIYILAKEIHPSKCTVVSTIGKFHDPLGITSPIITPFKVFLQQLCVGKITWDEPLTGNLLKEWEGLIRGLGGDQSESVPRCYHKESITHPIQRQRLFGLYDTSTICGCSVFGHQYRTEKDVSTHVLQNLCGSTERHHSS